MSWLPTENSAQRDWRELGVIGGRLAHEVPTGFAVITGPCTSPSTGEPGEHDESSDAPDASYAPAEPDEPASHAGAAGAAPAHAAGHDHGERPGDGSRGAERGDEGDALSGE